MEWILPFLLGFLLISAVVQLFWSYAISAIAQKDGQSDLMQILAWIPILQTAPMIIAGGGSVGRFVLGMIGLIGGAFVLGLTSAFVGGPVGGLVGALGGAFAVLVSLIYVGRIAWNTALSRDLSGWVGLLVFVPVANFFIYPYIAFHDGWSAPNKIGLVIGFVLAMGSTASPFSAVNTLNQSGQLVAIFAALEAGDPEMLELAGLASPIAIDDAPEQHQGDAAKASNSDGESIKILYSMQARFERLRSLVESPDLEDPRRAQEATDLLRSIEAELGTYRTSLDSETYQLLARGLIESEARIASATHASKPGGAGKLAGIKRHHQTRTAGGSPGPASLGGTLPLRAAPVRPIPVRASDECPTGTSLRTRTKADGEEEWCQQPDEDGGLRHGWYAHYEKGGQPESMGEYSNGLRIGVWTRFYTSGKVRAQAEFVRGLQHGWLLSFDESGARTKAVRFDQGAVVP